jgi:hypothetical protein
MAIVQMLPKWLWKRTALGRASEVRLQGFNPGEFNQKLIAKRCSGVDWRRRGGWKVAVFTLERIRWRVGTKGCQEKAIFGHRGYVFKLDYKFLVIKEKSYYRIWSTSSAESAYRRFGEHGFPMAR